MTWWDPETAEIFRRDGAAPIRGLLDGDQVETLRAGIDSNRAEPGPLAQGHGENATFFEDFCNWERIPEYEEIIRDAELGKVAAGLMGSGTARLFHDHVLVKDAGSTEPSPWHQDQPYYCVDGRMNVSFWIPVDPVSRENTLEFVAGSHASGTWYMPRTFISQTALVFDEGELEDVPDIEADRSAHEIVGWKLEPGDAVAFHMLTLHQAAGSPTLRRAFSVRILGDDATYAPRPHPTSPPFPGLDTELAAGDPLDHPRFPLLYAAEGATP
jgi:ectoine hydroxylase-related dioxygenase (phytanoyl-CoA dioxygenase family)